MILLSLNIRGVGGTLKLASMCRFLHKVKPYVIFLQETIVEEEKARHFMLKFVPSWCSCVVGSVGNSCGLLVTWHPNKFVPEPSICNGGIMLTNTSLENNKNICLLSVYGPCNKRNTFWDRVDMGGLLASKNLILAGDLSFTTGVE
jgi:hypothetical protein